MYVAAERTPLDLVGACSWTVSFLEDISRIHRGDMLLLQVVSSLNGSPGHTPSIVVAEQRKGTTINGGGGNVDPTSMFRAKISG